MIHEAARDARSLPGSEPDTPIEDVDGRHVDRIELARVGLVVVAAVAVWFHLWEPLSAFSVIGLAAALVGGYPIFKEAFANVVERRMTMELSMTIALVAALAIGQTFTALVITAFVLAAEILEHLTVARGRAAIGDLLRYLPAAAVVRRGADVVEVRVDALVSGDVVLVNPGTLIPVDGTVLAGHSFVDEARITGESMPAEKVSGSSAFAGTLNGNGALDIRVERLGRETSYGRIIEAVESAERSRAPVERLADQLAGYLVYFALGSAVLTFLITRNIVATISVIIVAGACGIAAGTPLAVLGAIGQAARAGAVVKGGRYLEALGKADVVIFDKTGTLTFGTPTVQRITTAPGVPEATLLEVAAMAEFRSEHPIGRAIVNYAQSQAIAIIEPQAFAYVPGRGVRVHSRGDVVLVGSLRFLQEAGVTRAGLPATDGAMTDVLVARGEQFLGTIGVSDTVRPQAMGAIAELRKIGIRTILLTGDAHRVAMSVAGDLGIDDMHAELLPEQKSAFISELVAAGKTVVMVGDGVNDAPALVAATVGVAMGSGTDVARESADVVLLGNDLARFVQTLAIARRTRRIIMQNFVGTLVVDTVGIVLAAIGLLNPLLSAFIHVTSELAFILNSTRMLARPGDAQPRITITAAINERTSAAMR